jgi:hypothetical protein
MAWLRRVCIFIEWREWRGPIVEALHAKQIIVVDVFVFIAWAR